mmetsp:Transcript_116887/g.317326  ORF Transcript_116887/g.317326 Transcript_116887/m.317326 type:complete len:215 (+) Transcript_116887:199-843(+)
MVRPWRILTQTSTEGSKFTKCAIVRTTSTSGISASVARTRSSRSWGVARDARIRLLSTLERTFTVHSSIVGTASSTATRTFAARWSTAVAEATNWSGATSTSASQELPMARARAPSTLAGPTTRRAACFTSPTSFSSVVSVSWPRASTLMPRPMLKTMIATPMAASGSRERMPSREPATPTSATTDDQTSLRWWAALARMTGEFSRLPTMSVAR